VVKYGNHETVDYGFQIDFVSSFLLPLLYILITSVLCWAGSEGPTNNSVRNTSSVVLTILGVTWLIATVAWTHHRVNRKVERRDKAVCAMLKLDREAGDLEAWQAGVLELFSAFDKNNSGAVELEEVRALLKMLRPSMNREQMREAMALAMPLLEGSEGKLDEETFGDVIDLFDKYMRTNFENHAQLNKETSEFYEHSIQQRSKIKKEWTKLGIARSVTQMGSRERRAKGAEASSSKRAYAAAAEISSAVVLSAIEDGDVSQKTPPPPSP